MCAFLDAFIVAFPVASITLRVAIKEDVPPPDIPCESDTNEPPEEDHVAASWCIASWDEEHRATDENHACNYAENRCHVGCSLLSIGLSLVENHKEGKRDPEKDQLDSNASVAEASTALSLLILRH